MTGSCTIEKMSPHAKNKAKNNWLYDKSLVA